MHDASGLADGHAFTRWFIKLLALKHTCILDTTTCRVLTLMHWQALLHYRSRPSIDRFKLPPILPHRWLTQSKL